MTIKTLLTELGAMHTAEEIAQAGLLPGKACDIRNMCATGELGHTPKYGPKGEARYWISDNDIAAWRRTHHQPATL